VSRCHRRRVGLKYRIGGRSGEVGSGGDKRSVGVGRRSSRGSGRRSGEIRSGGNEGGVGVGGGRIRRNTDDRRRSRIVRSSSDERSNSGGGRNNGTGFRISRNSGEGRKSSRVGGTVQIRDSSRTRLSGGITSISASSSELRASEKSALILNLVAFSSASRSNESVSITLTEGFNASESLELVLARNGSGGAEAINGSIET
jgi:hypothetical protein